MGKDSIDEKLAIRFGEPARINYLLPVDYQTTPPKDEKLRICCIEFDGRYYGAFPREVLVVRFGDGFKASVVRAVGEEGIDVNRIFRDYRIKSINRLKLANKKYSGIISSILEQLGERLPRARTLLEKALAFEVK